MAADTGYLEIIDARTDNALITGEGADFGSYEANVEQFNKAKILLETSSGRFLVDLHDSNGDLVDTFRMNARGFRYLTGRVPKTIRQYKLIDAAFWRKQSHQVGANAIS